MASVRWWERKWKLVYRSGNDKEGSGYFELFAEAALIRDYLLGLRPTPTREDILEINGTGELAYAVPIGETVDHAEVMLASEDDLKTLRDMARRVGERLPEE